MDFATIMGIVSGFVTLEEAGRGLIRDYLKGPKKIDASDLTSQDSELLLQIDRLKSEFTASSKKCITEYEIEAIKRQYFQSHTEKMQYRNELERVLDDLLSKINEYLDKNLSIGEKAILSSQRFQNGKIDEATGKVDDILSILKDEQVAESTKDFSSSYNEDLFWDQEGVEVKLCDVYIEPETRTGRNVLDEVNAFLKDSDSSILFIEAVAGSGKSSLMARLANEYGDKTHLFVKMSDLSIDGDTGLFDALGAYSNGDLGWKGYYKRDNVLFLDGYDEIAGRINYVTLQIDFQKFIKKKMKLVITTRPNYLHKLNMVYDKICMNCFDKRQIRDWILLYADKKQLSEERYQQYLEVLQDSNQYNVIENVITIPIFLYIIVNKHIDIKNIESQTQLFESVFDRLIDNKIVKEPYILHMEIAKRMGYFLQIKSSRRFYIGDLENFLAFANRTLEIRINEECLQETFESTFIKSISEGKYEKEFYHKSIQDYFAAAYIFEQLNKVVDLWKEGKRTYALMQFIELLQNHEINEEFEHLKFMILHDEKVDKEIWSGCLQEIFGYLLNTGYTCRQESWKNEKNDESFFCMTMNDFMQRNKLVTLNHIKIMIEILGVKLYNDLTNREFLRGIQNIGNLGIANNRAQFIWNYLYGQNVAVKELASVIEPDDVLAVMMSDNFATARKIFLLDGELQLRRGMRATGKFVDCTLERIKINKTKFHELFLEDTKLSSIILLACHLEYTEVKDCTIEGTTIFSSFNSVRIYDSIVKTSKIGNQKRNNPMKVCNSINQNVVFDTVTFLALECDAKTSFENVTFKNCTFTSSIGKDFQLINCKMDESTYNYFQWHHSELCKTADIEILKD